MIEIRRILYPTDFSEYAKHALPYVVELAKKFGAKVSLIHVVSVPTYAASYEIAVDLTSLREAMEDSAKKQMDQLVAQLAKDGVAAEGSVEIGTGFVEIIAAAKKTDADLIVMATHGWGAIKHMLMGSTAEKVVRKAPCPVLTVRKPEHEFVHP